MSHSDWSGIHWHSSSQNRHPIRRQVDLPVFASASSSVVADSRSLISAVASIEILVARQIRNIARSTRRRDATSARRTADEVRVAANCASKTDNVCASSAPPTSARFAALRAKVEALEAAAAEWGLVASEFARRLRARNRGALAVDPVRLRSTKRSCFGVWLRDPEWRPRV